jgi:hypothetical protein
LYKNTGSRAEPFPVGAIHGDGTYFFVFEQIAVEAVYIDNAAGAFARGIEDVAAAFETNGALLGADPDIAVEVYGDAVDIVGGQYTV